MSHHPNYTLIGCGLVVILLVALLSISLLAPKKPAYFSARMPKGQTSIRTFTFEGHPLLEAGKMYYLYEVTIEGKIGIYDASGKLIATGTLNPEGK